MKNKFLLLSLLPALFAVIDTYCQQQMLNPGFENWEEIGFGPDTLEPVHWNSLKTSDGGDLINSVIPVTLEQSTDSHSGMYSVKLKNDTILTLVAPGTMTNGRVHATLPPSDAYVYTIDSLPEFNTPFTDLPDSLTVWAKYFPSQDDIGHIIAILHNDTAKIADSLQTNWIAVATIDFIEETPDWTMFTAPFVYLNNNTPEYILFAIYAGDAQDALEGSTLYLDDFELIYHTTDLANIAERKLEILSVDNQIIVHCDENNSNEIATLKLHNFSGKCLFSNQISLNNTNKFQVDLPAGIYVCKIQTSSFNYSQKLFIW